MPIYTADELISTVRLRFKLPTEDVNADGYTDADIITFLNEEMYTEIIPEVMEYREEYFAVTTRTTLTPSISEYRIPDRAMGQKLRNIEYVDSNGSVSPMGRIGREDKVFFDQTTAVYRDVYFEGNHVVFPTTNAGGSIDFSFFFRPGELVLQADCRIIATVNTSTGAVTVTTAVPSTWTASNKFDLHSPKSGAEIKTWSNTASVVSGVDLTFTASDIDGSKVGYKAVEVGDYLCLEDKAALPGLPKELHPALAQAAVVTLAESEGDTEGAKLHRTKFQRMMSQKRVLIDNRLEGSPQKCVNRRSIWHVGRGTGYRTFG